MMDRILEPELMDDPEQARAYAQADFEEENQEFVNRFLAYYPDWTEGHLLDMGCGPADIPIRFARALPDCRITAVDASAAMIRLADQAIKAAGLENRIVLRSDRVQSVTLPEPADAGVSNSLLHHISNPLQFWYSMKKLVKSGSYVLVIWNSVDANLATKHAGAAVADLFPDDTAAFYERIPFRYHDEATIEADLLAAGFREIAIETVELISRAASARDAAIALTQGTPMRSEIERRGPDALAMATDAAERALRQFEGSDVFAAPMSAHIVTARK